MTGHDDIREAPLAGDDGALEEHGVFLLQLRELSLQRAQGHHQTWGQAKRHTPLVWGGPPRRGDQRGSLQCGEQVDQNTSFCTQAKGYLMGPRHCTRHSPRRVANNVSDESFSFNLARLVVSKHNVPLRVFSLPFLEGRALILKAQKKWHRKGKAAIGTTSRRRVQVPSISTALE